MPAELALLIALCAPAVHPVTAHRLIQHESGNHPFAIGINGHAKLSRQPSSEAQAVVLAKTLISHGFSIDMGYAQINSKNLHRLGLSVENIFKPCVNLQAMQTILQANYIRAVARYGEGQKALQVALSLYNTGHSHRGFENGYVNTLYLRTHSTLGIAR